MATIDKEIDYINYKSHSHNIIGAALQYASKEFGHEIANDLIEEFGLEQFGWSKLNSEDNI